jgi:uncharacterized protein (DUF2252 family)
MIAAGGRRWTIIDEIAMIAGGEGLTQNRFFVLQSAQQIE